MTATTVAAQSNDAGAVNCTLVIGFSQTADWYLAPAFRNSDPNRPERIVYMISGPFGLDVPAWAAEIEKALANIRENFPSAQMIALQPVVGAPADAPNDECLFQDGGQRVRASWQATPIITAIQTVAEAHADVVVGASTRLNSCSHYVDTLGHISNGETISGAADAAVMTGLFYRDFDFLSE